MQAKRRLGFMLLECIFIAWILVVSRWATPVTSLDLVLFALAVFRTARTVSFNEVGEPIRILFTTVQPDSCGAGDNVHPKEGGFRYVIGSLLSCPICTGTWSSLILYSLWAIYPAFGKTLVYVLAFAGASELIHYFACTFEWVGRYARVMSGKISPDKREVA